MTVYKSMYLRTLLYGCKMWVITETVQKRIQVAEIKSLRTVANLSIIDKISNENIREKA